MSVEPEGVLRVLLVEDDPADARATTERLSASVEPRFEIEHVGSVADALARLGARPSIDAVVLDFGLPDREGLDALGAVRAGAPHVPVVVLTNNEDADLAQLAIAAGAQDYLHKRTASALELERAVTFARSREERLATLDRERRAAVHASVAKTDFLAKVSHEIRTPLNTILGMAELLSVTRLSRDQTRQVESLRRAGDHLLSLVDDVLDVSRIEAGGLTLDTAAFELPRVVESAVDFLRPAAERKGIELRAESSADVPRFVMGDARRLRQILVNLLANGVKFTTAGSVRVVVAPDTSRNVPGALRLSVEDTGIGVAPDRIEAIFGSFVQGDSDIERQYGGAGLGLHIVKQLVDLMGGRISAESAVGVGSRFHVDLVLKPADPGMARLSPVPGPRAEDRPVRDELAGLRVLLVDDSEESRSLVEGYLAPAGALVAVAADAGEALGTLERDSFDVVLMDLHLPGMNGFDATREVRRREHAAGAPPTPIVALSADALQDTVQQALATGFTEHLAKPLRRAALMTLLRRYRKTTGPRSAPSATAVALLPKFIGHRERDVVTIRGALTSQDFDIIATLGHNMRGNGVSYGFPEVSAIGGRLETAAIERNAAVIEKELEKLVACIAGIREQETADPVSSRPESGTVARAEPAGGRARVAQAHHSGKGES